MYSIENDKLKVDVNSEGAELWSMQNKATGAGYIWEGAVDIWPRRSPVLFPICGRLLDDRYIFDGKEYKMGQHGFIRDYAHEMVEETESSLHFCFKANPETMGVYPFSFEFHTKYILEGAKLSYSFEVINTGDTEMFFSTGFHTGIAIPFNQSERFKDYSLVFEKPETVSRLAGEGPYITGDKEPYLTNQQEIALTGGLFGNSVILEGLKSNYMAIKNNASGEEIRVGIKGFPYVVLWSHTEGMPYICIEPWHGLPDALGHNKKLEEKKGIIHLSAKNKFSCCQTLEII